MTPQPTYNMMCSDWGGICCYADDSSYSYSGKSDQHISTMISTKFKKIAEYMESNQLKLNGDTTHLLCLMSDESRRAKPNFQIVLDTGHEIIESSMSEKLLGGVMGRNLKFTAHIQNDENSLLKVMNKRLHALKKVSFLISFKSRKMLANGIIMSKRTPIRTLLNQCGWLSVSQLGVFHSLVTVYKVLHTQSPHYLYSKLKSESNRELRSTACMRIKFGGDSQARTELAKRSFKYRATSQWNLLPMEIREAENIKTFKFKLKSWISENIAII